MASPSLSRRVMAAVVTASAVFLAGCVATDPHAGPVTSPTDHTLSPVALTVPAGLTAAPLDVPRTLNLPPGWKAAVFARVDRARFLAVAPSGDLLVSQPSTGTVLLVRRKANGIGTVSTFIGGLNRPHDIVFAEVGGQRWVYIAEADRIVRYPYANGDATAQPGQTIVDGLPDTSTPELRGTYAHVLKNIAIQGNTLYVSIASTCNACVEDTVSDPRRAAIYTYDAAGHNAQRTLYATGIRNAEGLAFAPGTGDLWAVVNNRDNILVPDDRDVDGDGKSDRGRKVTAYVDDHPPEEFIKVVKDGFYGWPFCNPNIDNGLRDMPFDNDAEFNADGKAADCSKANRVNVGIQAHTAPLGLTFTRLGAVVALHGSWNRSAKIGYRVIYFPWTANGPGEQRDLATGWLGTDGGDPWGRPVDIALDHDGSLIITDDRSGSLIRLTPPSP